MAGEDAPEALPAPTKRVNILLLSSTLWVGGAEVVVQHLATALDRRRFAVTVCHLKQPRGIIGDAIAGQGVEVVGVQPSGATATDYFTSLKLLKLIRERDISLVHTHMTHALVDASICKLLRPRLKIVHTFHFGNYPHTEGRVLQLERMFARFPDRLVAVGDNQREQILKVFGFSPSRIRTVHNGVATVAEPRASDFRRRIGAGSRIVIGTIATLIEQKGLRDLLEAARRVRNAGCPVMFVIVGNGHLRGELEALRHRLGLDDAVVFTGWIPDAAAEALPHFDIFFQPSRWEAMSMVILESMAAGRPTVATRVGENGRIIEDGVNGLLVDAGDAEAMSIALQRLVGDPCTRDALGKAAARTVRERFTVAHMARAYEQIYLDTLR